MKFSKVLFVLLIMLAQTVKAQDTTIVLSANQFDNFSDQIPMAKSNGWIFKPGNDTTWANPDIETAGWIKLKPIDLSKKYADKNGRLEGWFRIKIRIDSSLFHKKLWIGFSSWSATELYIDGKLAAKRGNTGNNGKPFEEYIGDRQPLAITFTSDTNHVFAVHFVSYLSPFPSHELKAGLGNFIKLIGPRPYINLLKTELLYNSFANIWAAVCALLSLLFWLLAFQNRQEKNLLWIAICTTIYFGAIFFLLKSDGAIAIQYIPYSIYMLISQFCAYLIIPFGIPILLIKIFKRKLHRGLVLFLAFLLILDLLAFLFGVSNNVSQYITRLSILFAFGICIYYIISSWKKLHGAQWAIVIGLFFSVFAVFIGVVYVVIKGNTNPYFFFLTISGFVFSLPLSLLVYVSIRFKEMIGEVRINAGKVLQLSEEKRFQAENQQKLLQEEVTRQTAEIRQTLDNLRATQSQLIQSEKMASLGELTAGIAHEIQNPLNFVNNFSEVNTEMIEELKNELATGNLQLAKEIVDDIKVNEEKINHHGKRADAIVKSMLEHSRSSTGVKEPTDINKLVGEYLRLSYHGLRAKDKNFNAETKTDFDESIGKINVVAQDIGRVLLNLFNNAFYAVSKRQEAEGKEYEPTVSVSTKKSGNSVLITVKDNGSGIPERIKEKIFQPFFTTKPTGSGTGLGLSLSYDIIKAHGGEIRVESKEGEGTEFIIVLPL